jgi:F-type H+-transporting ATPase subunit epsilon
VATMHVELVSVEARHAPLLAELAPGWIVRIQSETDPELKVAVHGGFLSVRPDGVSILAEMAEMADEIDVARAREALRTAEAGSTPADEAAKERAQARLRAAGEPI